MRTLYSNLVILLCCAVGVSACGFFVSPEERIERAQSHLEAGEDRAAAIELTNALRSEPENTRARLMLVEASLRLGDLEGAQRELELAKAGASTHEVTELAVRIGLAKGDFNGVLDILRATPPVLEEPHLSTYRGLALLKAGQPDVAVEAFQMALAADDEWQRAHVGLAKALAAQGKSDVALSELQKVLEREPTNAEAWAAQGQLLSLQGKLPAAIESLEQARKLAPGQLDLFAQSELLVYLIEAHLGSENLQDAKTAHQALAERLPNAFSTQVLAARIAMIEGNYTSAIADAQKALAAVPGAVQPKLLLGAALLANGNLNQAELELAELVRAAPQSIEARKLLAQVYLRLNRADRAAEVLEPIRAVGAGSAAVDALLGWAKLQAGDEEGGIELMQSSLAAQPDNENLKLELARAYIRSGAGEKAIELLRSIKDQQNDARREALLVMATALTEGPEAGATEIERALARAPKSVELLNLAASYFARQGDLDRARGYLKRAQQIDASDLETSLNSARVEAASGQYDRAEGILRSTLAAHPANPSVRLMLAELALRSGKEQEGIDLLEEIRMGDRTALRPRMMLAAGYLQHGKRAEAEAIIEEIVAAAQDKSAASMAIGRLLLASGRYDEALSRFQRALQDGTADTDVWMSIAQAQVALGNNAAAREAIGRAQALRPDWIVPAIAQAQLDLREGNHEAAQRRTAQLRQAHPKDPSVAALEGDIALALRAYKEAALAYSRAYQLQPTGQIAVREHRARRLGKLQAPEVPLRAWLERHPGDASVRLVLAESLMQGGNLKAAIGEYEYLRRAGAGSNAMVLNNLAWLYHETGHENAEQTAKQAYDLAPNVPDIADTYGWILVQSGKLEQGAAILKRAAAHEAAGPAIRYHHAVALAELGQREEARAELRALLALGESFSEAAAARQLMAKLGTTSSP